MHNLTSRQILLIHLALSFTAANTDDLIDAHWNEPTQEYDFSFQQLNITDDNRDLLAEELRSLLASIHAELALKARSDDAEYRIGSINTNIPAYQKYCRYDHFIPLVVLEAQLELQHLENQIKVTTHDGTVLQQFNWENRDQALWFAIEQACKLLGRNPTCLSSVALSSQNEAIQRTTQILGQIVTNVGTQAFEQALQQLQGSVEGVDPHRCYR